jgi:hypothetical protein
MGGGRLQIGTVAGFVSVRAAGSKLGCMAGFVGIRSVSRWGSIRSIATIYSRAQFTRGHFKTLLAECRLTNRLVATVVDRAREAELAAVIDADLAVR